MNDRYQTPLAERYASKEMQYIFSPDMKFKTWRRLWIALAETEKELGLDITDEQIAELKAHKDDINYEDAKKREKEVRHDVMSHVYAYGLQCPKAKGIIHLGATSCYVGDNTDIIIMTEGLKLVRKKLVNVINELSKFADKYKAQPTLAFTHFQHLPGLPLAGGDTLDAAAEDLGEVGRVVEHKGQDGRPHPPQGVARPKDDAGQIEHHRQLEHQWGGAHDVNIQAHQKAQGLEAAHGAEGHHQSQGQGQHQRDGKELNIEQKTVQQGHGYRLE